MRITVSSRELKTLKADFLVYLHEPKRKLSAPSFPRIVKSLDEFAKAVKAGRMKRIDTAVSPMDAIGGLLMIGVKQNGREHLPESEQYRCAAHAIYKHCKAGGNKQTVIDLTGADGADVAPWVAEGFVLGAYSFDNFKQKPSKFAEQFRAEILVSKEAFAEVKERVEAAVRLAECQNLARDLINQPGSVVVPNYLALRAKDIASENGLECEIWDEQRLAADGYNGLLNVGRGGDKPPRMIVLRHIPDAPATKEHLCLLGKGLTFDTGGYNIKTGGTMWEMIADMSGAAAVIGAMKAIAQSKPAARVTGIIVSAQNYIDSKAMVPGDCFFARNGKGIHVLNTDAEGRLILSDGLFRAGEEGATHLIDLATLTGSIVRALGTALTGLFANDQAWADRLRGLGEMTGEQMWQMPLFDEYRGRIDHWRADVNNTGVNADAGAITAALFLREFVPKNVTWAHMDIAGTAFDNSAWRYFAPGARGVMVRTLHLLAHEMAAAATRTAESL